MKELYGTSEEYSRALKFHFNQQLYRQNTWCFTALSAIKACQESIFVWYVVCNSLLSLSFSICLTPLCD